MTDLVDSMAALRARLPELERQLSKFGDFFPLSLLPRGLFRNGSSAQDCLNEITHDLMTLTAKTPARILQYGVVRLSQKIHVLVHICLTHKREQAEDHTLLMDKISTRAQWQVQAQSRLDKLTLQRAALASTLQLMHIRQDAHMIQTLQAELLDIDSQLRRLSHDLLI